MANCEASSLSDDLLVLAGCMCEGGASCVFHCSPNLVSSTDQHQSSVLSSSPPFVSPPQSLNPSRPDSPYYHCVSEQALPCHKVTQRQSNRAASPVSSNVSSHNNNNVETIPYSDRKKLTKASAAEVNESSCQVAVSSAAKKASSHNTGSKDPSLNAANNASNSSKSRQNNINNGSSNKEEFKKSVCHNSNSACNGVVSIAQIGTASSKSYSSSKNANFSSKSSSCDKTIDLRCLPHCSALSFMSPANSSFVGCVTTTTIANSTCELLVKSTITPSPITSVISTPQHPKENFPEKPDVPAKKHDNRSSPNIVGTTQQKQSKNARRLQQQAKSNNKVISAQKAVQSNCACADTVSPADNSFDRPPFSKGFGSVGPKTLPCQAALAKEKLDKLYKQLAHFSVNQVSFANSNHYVPLSEI